MAKENTPRRKAAPRYQDYSVQEDTPKRKTTRRKKKKKSILKRWWFWLIVVILVIGVLASGGSNDPKSQETTPSISTAEPMTTSDIQLPVEASTAPVQDEAFSVVLNWNEAGEYGIQKTLNSGTDQAYSFYEFHVPAGVYKITNKDTAAAQITVTNVGYITNEDGWEEYSGIGDIAVVMSGTSTKVTVSPSQYIKLSDNSSNILCELISGYIAPEATIEQAIRSRVAEKYTFTDIDRITINEDLGTELPGDYVALIYVTWTQSNSGKTSKEVLKLYSDDLAATLADTCPNVQELAVFWTVPYLENASAKCSYERRNDGMYEMDMMWDNAFNG